MKIPQEIKDRVDSVDVSDGPFTYRSIDGIEVQVEPDMVSRDGLVQVNINDEWVDANDALELAVFFKRLAKAIKAAKG